MQANDPSMGCCYPGCSAHPANPANGGPIFRLSAKGEAWVGACGKHFAKFRPGATNAYDETPDN